jgi:hypothetical protein
MCWEMPLLLLITCVTCAVTGIAMMLRHRQAPGSPSVFFSCACSQYLGPLLCCLLAILLALLPLLLLLSLLLLQDQRLEGVIQAEVEGE